MPGKEKKDWLENHRSWTIWVGLLLVIFGPVLLLVEQESHAGWAAMFAGLIIMMASRFEDVQEIGLASFRMKMFERRVDQLEGVVRDIKRLAKESSRLALASIQFSGRLSGFTHDYKTRVLADTRRLLNELHVPPEEIAEVESLWHAAVEFDYALWATGLSQVPDDLPQQLTTNWKQLRQGGIEGRSTPEEIRMFLSDADMLTSERKEILNDYEHYISTRQHRREDEWRQRRE